MEGNKVGNEIVFESIYKLFRPEILCFNFLGQLAPRSLPGFLRSSFFMYGLILNFVTTIGFPLHLTIGLFVGEKKDLALLFKNLAINLPCTVCSIKTLWLWWKIDEVTELLALMEKLQKRLKSPEEKHYYKTTVLPATRKMQYLFYFICFGTAIFGEVAVIIMGLLKEWRLNYPAYFPFDPYASGRNYFVAHIYQTLGVTVQIVENFVNDTFGPMALIILSGHIHMLGMRASKIGFDAKKTQAENDSALLECVRDHKDLLLFRHKLESVLSFYMFFQIIFTGSSICICIIYMIFWVNDAFTFIYYVLFVFAVIVEPFPPCYYGTTVELEFEKLTMALCSCNWIGQSTRFHRHLRIFTEQTKKPVILLALGMFKINLNTFFLTCRMAYSLFAVLMQMK